MVKYLRLSTGMKREDFANYKVMLYTFLIEKYNQRLYTFNVLNSI